jgi:hypothetical protein
MWRTRCGSPVMTADAVTLDDECTKRGRIVLSVRTYPSSAGARVRSPKRLEAHRRRLNGTSGLAARRDCGLELEQPPIRNVAVTTCGEVGCRQ